jgi:dTDP-4-dehydrorhamnose reductase
MKVIIGSGKVANIIKNNDDVILRHSQIEIKDEKSVEEAISNFPAGTVIVNTAAKINLEWCEENKEESSLVNVEGAVNVAKICKKYGHHLVHISSGCIFDGMETERVYTEVDEPTPAAWYAKTKADADIAITSMGYEKITIVRPRQLISAIPNPTNMLTKFVNLQNGDFIDSKNSVTCIEDMKLMIDHLVTKKQYGIYNLANVGWLSPYQIANKVKTRISNKLVVNKISYEDYLKSIKVKRVNTLLSINKLISTGFMPRNAMAALEWCLENYGK